MKPAIRNETRRMTMKQINYIKQQKTDTTKRSKQTNTMKADKEGEGNITNNEIKSRHRMKQQYHATNIPKKMEDNIRHTQEGNTIT